MLANLPRTELDMRVEFKMVAAAQHAARAPKSWGMLALILCLTGRLALAQTSLANVPVANSQASLAKPNIMILMDASTSMQATHMPDEVEPTNPMRDALPVGYRSAQCNALYFDPSKVYALPTAIDNTDPTAPTITTPAAPPFTGAPYDYYLGRANLAGQTVVDLSAQFQAFDANTRETWGSNTTPQARSDTPQAAYYWVHTDGQNPLTYQSAACREFIDPLHPDQFSSTDGGTWTKTLVTSAQQQNFANWYSFYRTRIALVKSSMSRAFSSIDNGYRVGFITVSPLYDSNPNNPDAPPLAGASVDPAKYEPIRDFGAVQRAAVYGKLFAQQPRGASPSREGLRAWAAITPTMARATWAMGRTTLFLGARTASTKACRMTRSTSVASAITPFSPPTAIGTRHLKPLARWAWTVKPWSANRTAH